MKLKVCLLLLLCFAVAPMVHADTVFSEGNDGTGSYGWTDSFSYNCDFSCYGTFPHSAYYQTGFGFTLPGVALPDGAVINSATLSLNGIFYSDYTACGSNSCNSVSNGGLFTNVGSTAVDSGDTTLNLLEPQFNSILNQLASGNPVTINGYVDTSVGSPNYGLSSTYAYNCDSWGNCNTGYHYEGYVTGENGFNPNAFLQIDFTSTPEPSSLMLMGSGLVGTLGAGKKMLRKFRG